MRLLSGFLIGFFCLLVSQLAAAQERPFVHKGVAKDAQRYEAYLKQNWKPGPRRPADLRLAAERAMATDPRAASRDFATAVVAEDKNPESWLGLARALLAIRPVEDTGNERYDLPVNASGAAYRAYQLSPDQPAKARALAVLGEAMQRRSYWRPAIDALKLSLELADTAAVRAAYEKLRAEHGFRMVDYATESDAAQPRVCVNFSENLSRAVSDYSKFVAVDGTDAQGVVAETSRLCVDGLAHGQRYEIQVRSGLPSDVDEVLEKPVVVAVYVPDRDPGVHFTGKSYVLPSRGQQGIPVVSVNTTKVHVEVYRIGDRNLAGELENGNLERQLSGYDVEQLANQSGMKIYEGELDVISRLNEEVTTAFPIGEAIGELKPGAYAMIGRPASEDTDHWRARATQWFIVSDLGLTAFSGDDGVHAFVRSLASASPVASASVRLVARNNEVLATATTDANGYARFEARLARGEGGLEPSILVAENGPAEYAFLDLRSGAFDLSDRGVEGREAPGPLGAYLYTERGVYRPGEEVNFTALVRDAASNAASLPVTLIVTRPDGVEHARYALSDQGLGGRSQSLRLGSGAMTGTWRAKIHADPDADPLTQVSFLVEDFVPERLDMTLAAGEGVLAPEEAKTVNVTGRFLYGPPAADFALEGDIAVRPARTGLAGFEGYQFGLAGETVSPVRQPIEGLPRTDAEGRAAIAITLPAVQATARPLEADVILRLREPGGRSIERSITLPVNLRSERIGIKSAFGSGGLGEGETAAFDVVFLDADGKRAAQSGLRWELTRLETSWQWYSRDGQWSYDAQTITHNVADGTVDAVAQGPAVISTPVEYGRYRLEVVSVAAGGPASSIEFNAGWYANADAADSPEVLDVALDKASYNPGDVAKLRISNKQGGKALVAVLGTGLHWVKEVEVPKGGADIDVPVGSDWGPGAYATALLYRPMDETAKRMPGRAIGVRWVGVDQSARTIGIALGAEAKIKSGATLSVPVTLSGLAAGEEARITVAAVDIGILNLTRFQAPAPDAYFQAQRQLAIEIRDFYGRLIDGMRAERGKIRSGGDASDDMALQGTPPVEETVAFYSGILKVGDDGKTVVEFQMPDFNGQVRLMAVAWSKDKLGHATGDVIVRDAVALTVAGPRFLTLGDEARLELSVHNVDGPAASYAVGVDLMPLDASAGEAARVADRTVEFEVGERNAERISIKPAAVGLHSYDVHVSGPEGIDVRRRLTFDVKPPAGDVKRTTVSTLAANGGKLTLSKDLVDGLIAGRTRVNVSVGPTARLDVPGLLTALDRYPYGCAEQTVSRALPLVYANAVAARIGIAADKALKERVQQAVNRVFEMQGSSGAFGGWGPGDRDLWLTSYVSDFLTRAKETGYEVAPIGFGMALDRLQNFIANAQDFDKGGEAHAYALFVLARNGRAPIGELRYYADTRLDRFATPLAQAQIGAALAMMGDKERAETAFKAALATFDQVDVPVDREDYGSGLRDGAALVALTSEAGIAKAEAPRLVNVIAKAYMARQYTSTQEQAWMLLAANALGDEAKKTLLAVDGAPVAGSLLRSFAGSDLDKGVVITNTGDAPTDAVISVIGASLTAEPAVSKGFTIARSYYTLDGTPVDLASASGGTGEVKQNERFVVVVKVESDEASGRVLLVDRLPAGFEIENPRLVDSGDIKGLGWLKSDTKPEHSEFRDDRFVAAFNLFAAPESSEDGEQAESTGESADDSTESEESGAEMSATVAYIVRAVTPGSYVHPAATIEDMYRPERYARTASGRLTVSAQE